MKKLLPILLAVVMILSLCACKSSEVKNVEALIDALAETDTVDLDQLIEAQEAYSALSEQDRAKVGNYDALEDAFEAGYYDLANRMLEIGYTCDTVSSDNISMWDNMGADYVQLGFLSTLFFCVEGNTWDDYVEMVETHNSEDLTMDDLENDLLFSAWALYPEACNYVGDLPLSVKEGYEDKILAACAEYWKNWNAVYDNWDNVFNDVTDFRNAFKDDHPAELTTLNNWSVTLDQYVDLSLELSGSLYSYSESVSDFRDEITQYVTEADSYY